MSETKDVLILAIESSCDETAAAVVKNGREVLSNVISLYLIWNGSSGAITRSEFTTRSSPFGPISVSGLVRSAFPIVRSSPGSPLI